MQIRFVGALDGKELIKQHCDNTDFMLPRIGDSIKLPYFTSTDLRDYRLKKVRVVDVVFNIEHNVCVDEYFEIRRDECNVDIIVELEKEYELED